MSHWRERSKQELFGELRATSHQKLDSDRWNKICRILDAWPGVDNMREEVIPYLASALSGAKLDPEKQTLFAPASWIHRAFAGEELPQLALSRAIDIPIELLLEHGSWGPLSDKLSHIELIEINAYDKRDEPFLSKLELEKFPALTGLVLQWSNMEDKGARFLARSEGTKRLVHLDLCGCHLGASGVRLLGEAPWFSQLEWLSLEWNRLEAEGIRELSKMPTFERLRHLNLEHNDLHDDGLALLGECQMPALEHLDLNLNSIDDDGLEALAESPILEKLRWLDLSFNHWGERGLEALARSPYLRALEELKIASNDATAKGFGVFARAPWLDGLKMIDLAFTKEIPIEQWVALFSREGLHGLTHVELDECELGDEDAAHLFRAFSATHIKKLDLRQNNLGMRAIEAIADNEGFANIIDLYLKDNTLGDEGVALLAQAPLMANIEHLHLTNTGLGGAGLEALVKHAKASSLTTLHIGANPLVPQDFEQLLAWDALAGIENLSLERLEFSAEHLRVLLERCQERITSLDLEGCPLTHEHMKVLCEVPLPMLGVLDLSNVGLQDSDLDILSSSMNIEKLSTLSLQGNELGEQARERFEENANLSYETRGKWFS